MSAPGLTSEAQLRYLLQWFGEFSELQREDFLPVLAAASGGKADQLAATLAALSCEDKPVSLFQCRIKLFNEWYPTWTGDEKDRLVSGVTEMDPDFGKKLLEFLTNGPKMNGDLNGTSEVHSPTEENVEAQNEPEEHEDVVEDEEPAITQDANIGLEIAAAS
ncbi:uncharacterized protein C14orf119 isoform X2 [Leguminivora glycinivorella]|nr:uncharacterized protein C14orf119 isoform X2 [Leguminivora glycinivorella]XP_047994818.1 uncharacterized protein C14orf119 isoform X2 [Leguminivora glycinivorella]